MIWTMLPMSMLLGFAAFALWTGHSVVGVVAFVAAVIVVPAVKVERL